MDVCGRSLRARPIAAGSRTTRAHVLHEWPVRNYSSPGLHHQHSLPFSLDHGSISINPIHFYRSRLIRQTRKVWQHVQLYGARNGLQPARIRIVFVTCNTGIFFWHSSPSLHLQLLYLHDLLLSFDRLQLSISVHLAPCVLSEVALRSGPAIGSR
jgi:hypothetical protein